MSNEKLENEEFENAEELDGDAEEWGGEEVEVYTLEDEEGSESEFTLIKRLEIDGCVYVAFEPFEAEDMEDDEDSFVILKVTSEDGEDVFVTIEDDEEFDKVADIFEEQLIEEMAAED